MTQPGRSDIAAQGTFRTADGVSQSAADFSAARNPRKTKPTQDYEKTAVGNMTNSKETQQRIEGDFDALFRSNKAAQNEVCAPMPRPLRCILCLPTCRFACCAERPGRYTSFRC